VHLDGFYYKSTQSCHQTLSTESSSQADKFSSPFNIHLFTLHFNAIYCPILAFKLFHSLECCQVPLWFSQPPACYISASFIIFDSIILI